MQHQRLTREELVSMALSVAALPGNSHMLTISNGRISICRKGGQYAVAFAVDSLHSTSYIDSVLIEYIESWFI